MQISIKARYVFPVAGEPIPDGRLTLEAGRIVGMGRMAAGAVAEDLGNVAVLPGLVNAHTHLEFSDLAEPLGSAGQSFPEWVRRVLAWRQQAAVPRQSVIERGLRECSRWGTTALGEIAQLDCPLDPYEQASLRTTLFRELIGPTQARAVSALEQAAACLEQRSSDRCCQGLSPHAPYTVRPDLLERAVSLSATHRVPLAFHLAESREELELLQHQAGPFYEFLRELASWDPEVIPRPIRPLNLLQCLANAHRVLIIHGNYLADDEMAFLGGHRGKMTVVYCPRTHHFFRHDDYPLAQMLAAGVRVCLGTDSRATAPDLSLLSEMRELHLRHPSIHPRKVLAMGTLEGARVLGRDRAIGTLEVGKFADLAVVALPNREAADPHDLLLESDEPVVATWFRGMPVAG